ncbi:MAG: helix-turn-helix domain-containing protein [Methanomassiliicoccales archaeon]
MIEASLTIQMPDNWVKDIGNKYPAPIKFIECMPFGDEGGRGLVEIEGDPLMADEIINEIRSHPDVCKVDISKFGDGKISGSIMTDRCVACKALTGSECFLTNAHSVGGGKVEWKVTTGANGSLATLIERLKGSGCGVEINSITKVNGENVVTKRQEQIIRLALERGYYDYPRRTTIRELAKSFNISPSTLGEILQRGERNIIESFITGKR